MEANESNAIEVLKRAARYWPKSLWLFAANGQVHVMRKTEDGKHAILPGGEMDPDYRLASIAIEADGGDW